MLGHPPCVAQLSTVPPELAARRRLVQGSTYAGYTKPGRYPMKLFKLARKTQYIETPIAMNILDITMVRLFSVQNGKNPVQIQIMRIASR